MRLQAAALTLGIDTEEMGDCSASFNQLGGDSLAAIQFTREVDELCGTTLPVSFVLDHSHSMTDIVEKVDYLTVCAASVYVLTSARHLESAVASVLSCKHHCSIHDTGLSNT